MKTLYVTDLDGTLLNKQLAVPPRSIKIINSLIQQGMCFTYATARSLHSSSIVTSGLNITLPVIIYNGAFIIDPNTKQIYHSCTFTKMQTELLRDLTAKYRLNPLVYSFINGTERVSYVADNHAHFGLQHYINSRKADPRITPLVNDDCLFDGTVFYITFIDDKENLLPFYEELKKDKSFNCILQQELYREEYWCEVMHQNATKANAVTTLKQLLSCHSIVSFGDAVNDIPMFNISDECYAVKDSVKALTQCATATIGSNEDDSVAIMLEKLFTKEDK